MGRQREGVGVEGGKRVKVGIRGMEREDWGGNEERKGCNSGRRKANATWTTD
jgi:hypothetical protein